MHVIAFPGHATPPAAVEYQPALDGVRALSVVAVLLFHGGFSWMSGGYVGVSMFFTLSGFLITSLALAEWDARGRLDVGAFYGRRVRRLIPASLVCIGAVVIAAFAGRFAGVTDLRRDVWGALAQVYNWVALASGGDYAKQMAAAAGQRSPLDHYWSLAIEEQFYWVWPLVLVVLLRAGRRLRLVAVGGVLAAAIAAAATIAVVYEDRVTYLATPARLPEILWGCALAVVLHRRRAPRWSPLAAVLGLAVIAWASVAWPAAGGPAYRGWMPAFAVASTALIGGLQVDSPLRRALSVAPLPALGRISYGIYLYHWPMFTLLDERRAVMGRPARFAVGCAATLVVALVSHRLIERPARRWRIGWRPSVAGAAAACVLLAAVAVAMPDRSGSFRSVSAATREEVELTALAAGETLPPIGDRPMRVYVVGDSTAYALGEGMIAWAADHPDVMQVTQGAAIGCGLNPLGILPDDDFREPCLRNAANEAPTVERLRPDVAVAMVTLRDVEDREYAGEGLLTMDDPRFLEHLADGYERTTRELLDAGAGMVLWLLPPVPLFPHEGSWALTLDPERQQAYRDVVVGLADRFSRVAVGDLATWIVDVDDPPARDDGLHLSPAGADETTERYLVPLLRELLGT